MSGGDSAPADWGATKARTPLALVKASALAAAFGQSGCPVRVMTVSGYSTVV